MTQFVPLTLRSPADILNPSTFFRRLRMRFDPAIAAHRAFKSAVESGQLGDDLEAVCDAESTFSSTAGDEARTAYRLLQEIGERHRDATAFQEFLIYITWQQV